MLWRCAASLPFLRHFSLNVGLFCIAMTLNVISNGFDVSVYNTIQAMDGSLPPTMWTEVTGI